MPKRRAVSVEDIAEYSNVCRAVCLAARGKRLRPVVKRFFEFFDSNVGRLSNDICTGKAPYGRYSTFAVRDPKYRIIHAACFEDRVLHHAVAQLVEPVLDSAMVPSSYACRKGKGNIAAVQMVQKQLRRHPWFVKIDIERFFASIDHRVLWSMLQRRLKGSCMPLLYSILSAHSGSSGKGLPIGALLSQLFGNYYLSALDRFLFEECKVLGHVRYMDDSIWWCASKGQARETLYKVRVFLASELALQCHEQAVQIGKSTQGVTYCGFKIYRGKMLLTKRKMKRYATLRKRFEAEYSRGELTDCELQQKFSSLTAMAALADSVHWCRQEHARNGVIEV